MNTFVCWLTGTWEHSESTLRHAVVFLAGLVSRNSYHAFVCSPCGVTSYRSSLMKGAAVTHKAVSCVYQHLIVAATVKLPSLYARLVSGGRPTVGPVTRRTTLTFTYSRAFRPMRIRGITWSRCTARIPTEVVTILGSLGCAYNQQR
jgi:hypothetical protein